MQEQSQIDRGRMKTSRARRRETTRYLSSLQIHALHSVPSSNRQQQLGPVDVEIMKSGSTFHGPDATFERWYNTTGVSAVT